MKRARKRLRILKLGDGSNDLEEKKPRSHESKGGKTGMVSDDEVRDDDDVEARVDREQTISRNDKRKTYLAALVFKCDGLISHDVHD